MDQARFVAAVWFLLALVAVLPANRFRISTALSKIVFGGCACWSRPGWIDAVHAWNLDDGEAYRANPTTPELTPVSGYRSSGRAHHFLELQVRNLAGGARRQPSAGVDVRRRQCFGWFPRRLGGSGHGRAAVAREKASC